MKIMLK